LTIFYTGDIRNNRAYKASQLRYRRPALALVQRDTLEDELDNIATECSELEWAIDDDETLIDIFDGDSDEISEFRFMFSDLSSKCERLMEILREGYITEHFDDYFVGLLGNTYHIVGYDVVEEDYFSLTRFEADLAQNVSAKRLMGLTKERLISTAGQCTGVMMSFLDIRHSYDCLKATFDLLKDDRVELLRHVQTINDAYEKLQETPDSWEAKKTYEALLSALPDRIWLV